MNDTPHRSAAYSLPMVLLYYLLALILLDGISLGAITYARHVLHLGPPYDRILTDYKGGDLNLYAPKIPHLHTYAFFDESLYDFPYAYPAPVGLIYALAFYPAKYLMVFTRCIEAMFLGGSLVVIRSMVARGASAMQSAVFVLASVALAYPIHFEIRLDNTEPVIVLLVCAGVWLMLRGRDHPAAALLGIAGSMKIYPFVFLGLLLARRKYAAIGTAAATAAVLTVIGLRFLTPSIVYSWHGVGAGLQWYHDYMFLGFIPTAIGYDHSLFAAIKVALRDLPLVKVSLALKLYLPIVATAGIVLYFTRIQKLPLINQVLCLTLAAIFLPPSSYDYTLLHLFLPWSLLVVVALERRKESIPGLTAAFLSIAYLMASEMELVRHGYGLSGATKALVFLALFYVALRYPFASSFDARFGLPIALAGPSAGSGSGK